MADHPEPSLIADPARLAALAELGAVEAGGDAALDRIARLAAHCCDAPMAMVSLVDGERQHNVARERYDADAAAPIGAGFCPLVVEAGRPVVIPDTAADPAHAAVPAAAEGGVRFYAGVPLVGSGGHALGALCVFGRAPRPAGLTADQLDALEALAAQVVSQFELRRALAHRRRLLDERDATIRARDALAAVQAAMAGADGDVDRILDALVAGVLDAVPAAEGAVLELVDGGELEYRAVAGALLPHRGLRVPLGTSLAGACVRSGEPMLVTDARADVRVGRDLVEPLRLGSAALAPVRRGDEVLGVLKLQSSAPDAFGERELQVVRLFAGAATAGLTEVRAATAQRAAAEAMERLAETLAAQVKETRAERDLLWEISPDLYAVWEADGRPRSLNPAWEAALGWRADRLLGRVNADLIHPDDRAAAAAALAEAAAGRPARDVDVRVAHAGGGWRTFSWTCLPHDGLVYATGRDVTDGRLIEDQLRQSQKMEAVGQLTGGVAHDFNNLLTIIRASVDLLRRPELAADRRRRYLDAVSDTVDRAARLTGQLLAFARRQALTPEPFDVAAKLSGVMEMLGTLAGSRVGVLLDAPASPVFALADVSQFETALVNMAANARDAMEDEGVITLRLEGGRALPPIRGHAGAAGPFVAVSVADTGSGIPPDRIASVFEPFFTTKSVGKGTGLGLSQVFGFAKQSGGDVEVQSQPGEGATFTLYLPQVAAPAHAAGEADQETPVSGEGRSVLVVEDNVEVGGFATQILTDLGFQATWVANAEEALERLAADDAIDIVFSDVVMPGMGGVELARRLRAERPALPVVLASGYSHVLAEEGAHGFRLLQKPYSAERLSRELSAAMRARAPQNA